MRSILTRPGLFFAAGAILLASLDGMGGCLRGGPRELPDSREWKFSTDWHGGREHTYLKVAGLPDSMPLSDWPSSGPLPSPDGRWLAFQAFNDSVHQAEVTMISRRLERFRAAPGHNNLGEYTWSPNGKLLAGSVRRWSDTTQYLFVAIPDSRVWWFADSLGYAGSYEFAWDSASQFLAICRVVGHEDGHRDFTDGGQVVVYGVISRQARVLGKFRDAYPTDPTWDAGGFIKITKVMIGDEDSGDPDSTVELRYPVPTR